MIIITSFTIIYYSYTSESMYSIKRFFAFETCLFFCIGIIDDDMIFYFIFIILSNTKYICDVVVWITLKLTYMYMHAVKKMYRVPFWTRHKIKFRSFIILYYGSFLLRLWNWRQYKQTHSFWLFHNDFYFTTGIIILYGKMLWFGL